MKRRCGIATSCRRASGYKLSRSLAPRGIGSRTTVPCSRGQSPIYPRGTGSASARGHPWIGRLPRDGNAQMLGVPSWRRWCIYAQMIGIRGVPPIAVYFYLRATNFPPFFWEIIEPNEPKLPFNYHIFLYPVSRWDDSFCCFHSFWRGKLFFI